MAVLTHPLILVAAGGATGSVIRYVLGRAIDGHSWHGGMPWGTLTINLIGSFCLGFLGILFLDNLKSLPPEVYFALGTGVCGGFTTFSTFEWETYRLIRDGHWPIALGYVTGSVVGGFLTLLGGIALAWQLFGHRG